MSDEQQFIEGMRRTVQALSSSIDDKVTWEDVEARCKALTGQDNTDTLLTAVFTYHFGRDTNDAQLMGDAKKLIGVRVPDLERRLPWYVVIFDIMDRGTFHGGVLDPHYFAINEETARKFADYLAGETGITPKKTLQAVTWLTRELGEIPGVRYALRAGAVHQELESSRFKQIYLICRYLYSPMEMLKGKTAADFHYDDLLRSGYARTSSSHRSRKEYKQPSSSPSPCPTSH